jgi:hypothetical protein
MNKVVLAASGLFATLVAASTVTNALSQERGSAPSDNKTIQFEGKVWGTDLAENVAVQEFKGRSALSVRGSLGNYVYLPSSSFVDGTIEVDVAVEGRGAAGIVFRGSADGTRSGKVCFLFVTDGGSTSENPVRQAVISRRDGRQGIGP